MADDRIGIRLEPRDFALLRELLECRVLSLRHLTALHFGGKLPAATKRLRNLKAAGFISERPRKTFEESVLFLTRQAFQALRENGHLANYPKLSLSALDKRAKVSNLTINHELSVADVKVAFTNAVAEQLTLTLTKFSTWPRLFSFTSSMWVDGFRMTPSTIKPDGFAQLQEAKDGAVKTHTFFVEVDMTHETLTKFVPKAVAYLSYYSSGDFAVWRGGRREDYKQHPFRVLGVFKSEERKRNFAERLLHNNPPIRHQWYLASYADTVRDPLSAIWTTPADYAAGQPNSPAESTPRPLIGLEHKKTERPHDRSAG